jgi:glycosyltransferase involved in cell wall biosynthesis
VHIFAIILLTLAALVWVFYGLWAAWGALHLPWLRNILPAPDGECPFVSILLSARDEEEKLPAALSTLLNIDYPRYEVIAVNDRSADRTGQILDEFARNNASNGARGNVRLHVIHTSELPRGWLGKPYGLQRAWEKSSGEWLVFTDADARFSRDVLRRSVSLIKAREWDHFTIFGEVEMIGFWEKASVTFFGMGFYLATDPYRVSNPRSSRYVGVGAFQMVRRTAYEASGTHRRLAMEVIDDMKLGKIVKLSGYRSGLAIGPEAVIVRWHAGLGNLVRGVTKNFFAASGFSIGLVLLQLFALICLSVVPFAALFLMHGAGFILAAISVGMAICFQGGVAMAMRVSPIYALTHPLGALIFFYMLLRSTILTIWQQGIIWRGTFYPLDELRRGRV